MKRFPETHLLLTIVLFAKLTDFSETLQTSNTGPHSNSIEGGWGWKDLGKSLLNNHQQPQQTPLKSHYSGFSNKEKWRNHEVTAIDNRTLDELYQLALQEGGKVIVYAGGDTPSQQDFVKEAFESRFPGMVLETIVDFSKNHNARIDFQLSTNNLIPDVAQLQTLGDFKRWRNKGHLLPYKGIGWDQVYPEFKDSEGYYTALFVLAFSNNINVNKLNKLSNGNNKGWPTEAGDYTREELKGRIVSTWPNDDDAVLFLYKLFIDKYGWGWMAEFLKSRPLFVRGTEAPDDIIRDNGTDYLATFTVAGSLRPEPDNPVKFVVPRSDPFVSWGQRAAIFKQSKRPHSAKLYMSWWNDFDTQRNIWEMWSVRKDVPVPYGFKNIFHYPGQTDPIAFERFVEDRTEVERFKGIIRLFVGEPVGPSPPGELGTSPESRGLTCRN